MRDNIPFKDAEAMFDGALRKPVDMQPLFVLLPQMVDLLLQKHRKDSSLSFVVRTIRPSYWPGTSSQEYVHKVAIHMGDDLVATLRIKPEAYPPNLLYGVYSSKTATERPRKGWAETRNYNSAVGYLDKYVLPIGNAERYATERACLENMKALWRMEISHVRKTVGKALSGIVSTASQFREVCSLLGVPPAVYAQIEERFNTLELLAGVVGSNASYNYVHIHNGECEVMSREGMVGIKSYPADALPPELAVKIGMLKVANPEVLVKGVGVKKSDNTFIVIGAYDAR